MPAPGPSTRPTIGPYPTGSVRRDPTRLRPAGPVCQPGPPVRLADPAHTRPTSGPGQQALPLRLCQPGPTSGPSTRLSTGPYPTGPVHRGPARLRPASPAPSTLSHCMRFGKIGVPALDINHQLDLFLDRAGTRPDAAHHAAATAQRAPAPVQRAHTRRVLDPAPPPPRRARRAPECAVVSTTRPCTRSCGLTTRSSRLRPIRPVLWPRRRLSGLLAHWSRRPPVPVVVAPPG